MTEERNSNDMKDWGSNDVVRVCVIVSPASDDPVRMFSYQKQSPNSVIKFLSDLYSCRHTANLLYTNDAKVLIDIIVRQLNDLSPGDQVLCHFVPVLLTEWEK